MNIKFLTLTLQCRQSREVVVFSPQLTFIHGQVATGKSTVARLIDYCLGGDLERTPAILTELVSVSLSAKVGEHEVVFEREAQRSNQVQVTWRNPEGESGSVLAPLQALPNSGPVWGDAVFNLSDLIFFLLGVSPLKVRRSKRSSDSPLVRLSFRDVMWYCYLQQDILDSSFYHLKDPFRGLKSQDVMRFVAGYHTERLSDLEAQLDDIRDERQGKIEAARQLRAFLKEFGFGSEEEVTAEIEHTRSEWQESRLTVASLHQTHFDGTHFADDLRARLRALSDSLMNEEQALRDIDERIVGEKALRAELLSTKFKLARATSAANVLSGVDFKACPSCGLRLDSNKVVATNACRLCGQVPQSADLPSIRPEAISRDLDSRIGELEESIELHSNARKQQERLLDKLRTEKTKLDVRLSEEMANYDSLYLANARNAERRVAALEERISGLERFARMPVAVSALESEVDDLTAQVSALQREIAAEKDTLTKAEGNIKAVERAYHAALIAVGFPGFEEDDEVSISRRSWLPYILPGGDQSQQWTFYSIGSGGKKTLMNICYALAVHTVAAERNLPLPTFLIIDSPMKNIGDDVNRDLFQGFYHYTYSLMQGPLANTQIIIIDNEFTLPDVKGIDVVERYMTRGDSSFPPLISYYRGH